MIVGCTPASPTPPIEKHATPDRQDSSPSIPFTLTDQNNIVIAALLNDADAVNLMLHTAATGVALTEDAARKTPSVKFTRSTKVQSWGGGNDARVSPGNRLRIGDVRQGDLTIWEDKLSGKDSDGKFGLDHFGKRIVEIDYEARRLILHDDLPSKLASYERLPLFGEPGNHMVEAACTIAGKEYVNRFLVHSGYADGVLLDDEFAAKTGVDGKIEITDETKLQDSFGHTIRVKKGVLPTLALGKCKLEKIPVGFFAGTIGRQKVSVIGCDVLRRFDLAFDVAKKGVYLSVRKM